MNQLPRTALKWNGYKKIVDHTERNKEIKRLYLETVTTYQKLADEFNISVTSVWKAVNS